MIESPLRAALANDSGVEVVAVQIGGRGFCVGRGNEVTF